MATSRTRSPSYPIFDLETATKKALSFYQAEGLNKVAAHIAPKCWGLTESSSAGYRYISALIQYGLFDDEGSGEDREVFLTELGKTIVIDEREQSANRDKALKEAALNPPIFKKLWEESGPDLPSDSTLKYRLIKDYSFNQRKVVKFIEAFRSTIGFVGLDEELEENVDSSHPKKEQEEEEPSAQEELSTSKSQSLKIDGKGTNFLNLAIPLTENREAVLKIPRPLTKQDYQLLKALINSYLDISKPALVTGWSEDTLDLKEEGTG